MFSRLAAASLSVLALLTFSACTAGGTSQPSATTTAPQSPSADQGGEQTFEGDVSEETVTVGPQEVTVPKGIKLPAESVVSKAEPYQLMLIDEDPQAVVDAVTSSAAGSGYTVYATPDDATTVWVGNGNAVSLLAIPGAQLLVWGPESMKDVLAQPQG